MQEQELASISGETGALPAPGVERAPWVPPRSYLPDGHPIWKGNLFQLLRDGVEAYPAMLQAIRQAQWSVRLETYMFIDDAVGRMFGRALAEAAARGVQVTVLYDALGSWTTKRAFFGDLRAQGVDARAFRPLSWGIGLSRLIRRDHRKLLAIDGQVAFVGGVNIASHWAPKGEGDGWRDDVLRIEGPAVRALERRFGASWRGEVRARLVERHADRLVPLARRRGDVEACVVCSPRAIHRAYVHAIERARSRVLIAAAYFIPDRKMLAALRAAAERGVEVSLILAGKTDHPVVRLAGRALYERLMRWGVRVHEWHDGVLHAKTAVVDGVWGTVGSFNLERMSLRFNRELNVVFADPRWGGALERSFRSDCGLCHPISPELWRRRPLWHKVLERVAWLFRKLL